MMKTIISKGKNMFLPFETLNATGTTILIIVELIVGIFLWGHLSSSVIPSPLDVVKSFLMIIDRKEFINSIIQSIFLTIQGIFFAMIISLFFAYLSTINVITPIANLLSKFRYLTITGVTYVFVTISPNSHDIKIMLLLFGIIPFFTTSLLAIIADINKQEYELCKTMKMNRWETLYEVVIVGRLHLVLETMRQNFAIAWLLITLVEGMAMNESGLGVMLITSARVLNMGHVFALLLIILVLGTIFDFLLRKLTHALFPYYQN